MNHRLSTQLTLISSDESRSSIYLWLMDEAPHAALAPTCTCMRHRPPLPSSSLASSSHTWVDFTRPLWTPQPQVEAGLQTALQAAYQAVGPPCVTGLLSMRLQVEPDGSVSSIDRLVDTLVVDPGQLEPDADGDAEREGVATRIIEALSKAIFEKCDAPTQITIPFTFD